MRRAAETRDRLPSSRMGGARNSSPPRVQVKAAGEVRTFDRLLAVRVLGVSRVGATATKAILDECRKQLGLTPVA